MICEGSTQDFLRCTMFTDQHSDKNRSLIKIKKQNCILLLWAHFSATRPDMNIQCPLGIPYEDCCMHAHRLAETEDKKKLLYIKMSRKIKMDTVKCYKVVYIHDEGQLWA